MIKNVEILVLLVLLIHATEAVSSQSNWILKRKYGDASIYTSHNKTRLTVKYKTATSKKGRKNFSVEFVKKLERDKKKLLSLIGIKDWKVDKTQISNQYRAQNIILKGSYVDNSGAKIYFMERHVYFPAKNIQILMANKDEALLATDIQHSNLNEFIN